MRIVPAPGPSWIVLCLPALCVAQSGPSGPSFELREGRIATVPHDADERVEYLFEAAAGQAYVIELQQDGLDFTLSIVGPNGRSRTYDSPLRRDERELVLLEDGPPGTYRISVASGEHTGAAGSHSIVVSSLPPDALDDEIRAWRAMTDGAAAYHRGGREGWAAAVAAYESAAALWRETGHARNRAQAIFSAATIEYWELTDWTRSAELASVAASLYTGLSEPVLAASALHLFAAALIEQANMPADATSTSGAAPEALFDEAFSAFSAARRALEEHGRSYDAGLVVNNIGLAHYYRSEYRRAVARWQEAAALFQRLDEWSAELLALENLAVVAAEEGSLLDAIEVLARIAEILPRDRLYAQRALTLDNLAASHKLLGNLDEALRIYADALSLHRQIEDAKGEAQSLRGIGTTYFALGYLDLAKKFLEQALPLAETSNDGRGHYATRRSLGNVAFVQGDYAAALEHHRAALALAPAPVDVAAVQVLLAEDYVALGRYAEARELAAAARAAAENAGTRLLIADALQQSGRARAGLGETDDAMSELGRALDIYRELTVSAGEAEALNAMALAAAGAGRVDEAVGYGARALATLEGLRSRVADPELRAYYSAARRGYYEAQIDMLMALHRESDGATDSYLRAAFETSERSRARVMVDLISESEAETESESESGTESDADADAATDAHGSANSDLLARRTRLIDRLAELRYRRDLLLGRSPPTAETEEAIATAVGEMATIENELRVLETTLRRSGGPAATLSAPSTLSLPDIQDALDAESALLQYALGEQRSHAWIVTRDSVRAVELPPRDALESLARAAYEQLIAHRADAAGRRELASRLQMLAAAILGPVLPELAARRIVIASDGALQYIPFGVLPDPRADDGRRLLERFEIVAVPSMSALLARGSTHASVESSMTLAVIADPVFEPEDTRLAGAAPGSDSVAGTPYSPDELVAGLRPRTALLAEPLARLPFSGQEAAAIAELVPSSDRLVLTGVDASRQNVLGSDLSRYRFVHFATHGLVDSQYPALTGLALSSHDTQGAHRDGFLRLADIQSLRLNADLVVLSACETALGREIRGEGLLGLTQAFMYAGARGTVASLWQVPDRATAELMARFYDGMLTQDLRPAEALRAAQLSIASDRRWRDPYFWGAFVLMGDWR